MNLIYYSTLYEKDVCYLLSFPKQEEDVYMILLLFQTLREGCMDLLYYSKL